MDVTQGRLDELIDRPSEGLNVEIKSWIDPQSDDGIAKIAKASIGLYNRNGGYLIFGFDNKTLEPDPVVLGFDVHVKFHIDIIQGIVSRYASIPFEVQVGYANREGRSFPVIAIPHGVTVPVAAKKDLFGPDRKYLIREDVVYFRTLSSNGTPSTSAIRASDWRELVEICFDNRDADIGRFIRRHLGADPASQLNRILTDANVLQTLKARTQHLLASGANHREEALKDRAQSKDLSQISGLGSWEVALAFDPPAEVEDSDINFLNKIDYANPQFTGWPAWIVTSNFREEEDQPYKKETGWEELLITPGGLRRVDFYRLHARGEFYQWRVLQDDMTDKIDPKTALDPSLMVYRVAEVIAVGLSFAKALRRDDQTTLGFSFRWNGLRNRKLEAWAETTYFSPYQTTREDVVESYIELSADTPIDAIAPYVQRSTAKLLSSFKGFEYNTNALERVVTRLLERR